MNKFLKTYWRLRIKEQRFRFSENGLAGHALRLCALGFCFSSLYLFAMILSKYEGGMWSIVLQTGGLFLFLTFVSFFIDRQVSNRKEKKLYQDINMQLLPMLKDASCQVGASLTPLAQKMADDRNIENIIKNPQDTYKMVTKMVDEKISQKDMDKFLKNYDITLGRDGIEGML